MTKIKVILLISLVVLIIMAIWTWPDGKVRVVFCNVGQGDGIIVTQGSFQMLIDVGPKNNRMLSCLEDHLPFWDTKLEIVIISHWDEDHSAGLRQVLAHYQVDKLYSGVVPEGEIEQKYYSGNLALGDIVKYNLIALEVLNPGEDWGNDNDNSVVGWLKYKDSGILLMGDVSSEVEQKLIWRKIINQKIDYIKISHHGSAEGTSKELLNITRPKEAVISVGKNSFGHPNKQVLDRLNNYRVKVRRTDQEGTIVFEL